MTKLTELDAEFVKTVDGQEIWDSGMALTDADGILFDCPLCGKHSVLCWFKGKVSDDLEPKPGRWSPTGTNLNDLTLAPSVHLNGPGCGWHGWVKDGDAT